MRCRAIKDGQVVGLGRGFGDCDREIDAAGKLVLPGGVEGHCHIEQMGSLGVMIADDFYTGTVAAGVRQERLRSLLSRRNTAANRCARQSMITWRARCPRP